MRLCTFSSDLVIGRMTLEFIKETSSSDPIDCLLCKICAVHFSDKETDKAYGPQFIWLEFYCIILQCEDIHKYYYSEFIWEIFLLEWRKWWFDDIVFQFPTYYNTISITEPQQIFMD